MLTIEDFKDLVPVSPDGEEKQEENEVKNIIDYREFAIKTKAKVDKAATDEEIQQMAEKFVEALQLMELPNEEIIKVLDIMKPPPRPPQPTRIRNRNETPIFECLTSRVMISNTQKFQDIVNRILGKKQ
jgi:hypothetical protein